MQSIQKSLQALLITVAISMGMISNRAAFQIVPLHAASAGRGELLFGKSLERVKKILPDFVDPLDLDYFPDLYLEFPFLGDPFLDVTVLYTNIPEDVRIISPLTAGMEQMTAWLAQVKTKYPVVYGGFEIDTKLPSPSTAVHFQPRGTPETINESEEGDNERLITTGCLILGQLFNTSNHRFLWIHFSITL